MNIPVSGLIVLGVTTYFMFMRRDDLLLLAVVMNAFAAASVVNLGGAFPIGITPYFFVAGLLTMRLWPRWIAGKVTFFRGEPTAAYLCVMALFTLLCVFSAFILPMLFDSLPVDVPRAGVALHRQIPLAPLHWSFSNGGQAAYMILNFFVILEFMRKSNEAGFPARLSRAFAIAGLLAAGVGLFQVTCGHVGMTFPEWLFNSNVAWGQSAGQKMAGGFSRMSATFVEPSDAGKFFACWMVFELTMAISSRQEELWHWLFATIATVALFLTTSSTGYVIALVSWCVAVGQTTAVLFTSGLVPVRKMAAIVAAVGSAIVVMLLVPGVWDLLNAALFEKQQTDSAIDRGATLGRAVDVFFHTFGLGAGLGSNRAMSIALYVLSNLGLVGSILFIYILLKPYLMARIAATSPDVPQDLRGFIRASGAAFAANFVGLLVSGAEITGPEFWILLGMLLAGTRQAWLIENGLLGLMGDGLPNSPDARHLETSHNDIGGGLRPSIS